jgi:sterol desaturase/sphingolipid hydroxylase (fatty acid hydroxylase superfamily)
MRMGSFAGVFVVMALWEVLAPRRSQTIGRAKRWPGNLGIVVLDTLFVRLLIPAGAVGAALFAQAQGWGLFNVVAVPDWASVGLSLLLLDLAIYAQHIIFHKIPVLWRLHRVHHADVEFDVSTGVRFHPAETLLSMLIKATVVIALGAPPSAVLIFEVLLNATAMFNHGNVRLPRSLDWCLRLLVVTPDMHRVHHSVVPRETDSNFGFNVPWWDRLFGTYRPQPEAGHDGMTIGLDQFRDIGDLRLDRMLIQPFRSNRGRASATAPRSKVP